MVGEVDVQSQFESNCHFIGISDTSKAKARSGGKSITNRTDLLFAYVLSALYAGRISGEGAVKYQQFVMELQHIFVRCGGT